MVPNRIPRDSGGNLRCGQGLTFIRVRSGMGLRRQITALVTNLQKGSIPLLYGRPRSLRPIERKLTKPLPKEWSYPGLVLSLSSRRQFVWKYRAAFEKSPGVWLSGILIRIGSTRGWGHRL